jgi:hypothetical protein
MQRAVPLVFRRLAPRNRFLDGLFCSDVPARRVRRRLPEHIVCHLLFGYGEGGPGGPGDGTVPRSSILRPEAQEEALTVRGCDKTHVGILSYPAVAARMDELLGQMR